MSRFVTAGAAAVLIAAGSATAQPPADELYRLQQRLDAQQRRIEVLESQLRQVLPVVADPPERPAHVVLGEFPGSVMVPGTELSIRLSGYIKLDAIVDFDPIGSEEVFVPSTIPTDGGDDFSTRTRLHALQSRFGVEVRQAQTPYGPFRILIEGDFFGSQGSETVSNSAGFRLRQAYGELGRILIGQTWSTFMDVAALPELLDFQGPNGQSFVRQPQLRYTRTFQRDLTLAAALENPEGDVLSGDGNDITVDQLPDLIARASWEYDWGHLQAGGLLRRISVDTPGVDDEETGWGLNLSTVIKVNEAARHNLAFQLNGGDGIGRYILDIAGTSADAYLTDTGRLQTQKAIGGYVSYQHWWTTRLRSTAVYGQVVVDVAGVQPDSTLERSYYAAANLIWSPLPRVNVGIEFLHGRRKDAGGADGSANRLQLSSQLLF